MLALVICLNRMFGAHLARVLNVRTVFLPEGVSLFLFA
jgi:hypothetical protein